jgi:hypothetical protein
MATYVNEQPAYDVRISGVTPDDLEAADGSYLYFSLFGWPNEALLKRLKIHAEDAGVTGKIDVKVLRSPGLVNSIIAGGVLSAESYTDAVLDDAAGDTPADALSVDVDFGDGVPVYDNTLSNQLHLYIESEVITAATKLVVEAFGTSINNGKILYDRNWNNKLWHVSLWRNNEATSVWTDITTEAINIYNLDAASFNMVLTNSATPEYLYIGNDNMFNKIFFYVKTANTTSASTINVEYSDNGGTWTALTVYDSTNSFKDADDIPMSFPGSFVWETPTDWAKVELPDTFGDPPDTLKRYWVRLSMDDITTNPTFYWIRPHVYTYIS